MRILNKNYIYRNKLKDSITSLHVTFLNYKTVSNHLTLVKDTSSQINLIFIHSTVCCLKTITVITIAITTACLLTIIKSYYMRSNVAFVHKIIYI